MAGVVFNGKDAGIVNSVSHSGTANEREGTGIGSARHVYRPGIPDDEVSIEAVGSHGPFVRNEVGPLVLTYSNGEVDDQGAHICTSKEKTDTVDDGPGYSATFKPALA